MLSVTHKGNLTLAAHYLQDQLSINDTKL